MSFATEARTREGHKTIAGGYETTRVRTKSTLSQSKRPAVAIAKAKGPTSQDVGPGAYDVGSSFTTHTKGYSWGKPGLEKRVFDNRDYGYDPTE